MEHVGLYIHIPFCVRKCLYCDFLSYPADEAEKKQYVELLCREIRQRSSSFKSCTVPTVFIGGGTPSCLPGEDIALIMDTVKDVFALEEQAEVTLEMNPGTVDPEKLRVYRGAGINRLSMGLQSADNGMLRTLGRIHTYEDFLACYEMAACTGFENISVDIMSSLPGQSVQEWEDTLRRVASLSPAHISCYSLILEEGTPFFDRKDQMVFPDEDEDREMYHMAKEVLAQYGYRRYEISNYAKPGMESRHNTGYWKRTDYLGFGLGASSLNGSCRYKNPSDRTIYNEMVFRAAYDIYREDEQKLSRKDIMEEYMFLGLRMMEGIDKKAFEECFGEPFEQIYGEQEQRLLQDGLIELEGSRLFLTDLGIDVSNHVFCHFLF